VKIGTWTLVRLQIDIDECYSACTIHDASITAEGCVHGHVTSLFFKEIIYDNSETVQDGDTATIED